MPDMTADCIGAMTVMRQFYYDDAFMTPVSSAASSAGSCAAGVSPAGAAEAGFGVGARGK